MSMQCSRGVILFDDCPVGIRLEFNGNRTSVEQFIRYARLKNLPCPQGENLEGMAGLATIITNFVGNDAMVANIILKTTVENMPIPNNGIYTIKNWEIINHKGKPTTPPKRKIDIPSLLQGINMMQPLEDRPPRLG